MGGGLSRLFAEGVGVEESSLYLLGGIPTMLSVRNVGVW